MSRCHRRHSESEAPEGLIIPCRVQGEVPQRRAVHADHPDVEVVDQYAYEFVNRNWPHRDHLIWPQPPGCASRPLPDPLAPVLLEGAHEGSLGSSLRATTFRNSVVARGSSSIPKRTSFGVSSRRVSSIPAPEAPVVIANMQARQNELRGGS